MWEQARVALDQSTTSFLTGFARLLPGLVAVIVALLISFIVAWLLAIVVRRLLAGMQFDERMARGSLASISD